MKYLNAVGVVTGEIPYYMLWIPKVEWFQDRIPVGTKLYACDADIRDAVLSEAIEEIRLLYNTCPTQAGVEALHKAMLALQALKTEQ